MCTPTPGAWWRSPISGFTFTRREEEKAAECHVKSTSRYEEFLLHLKFISYCHNYRFVPEYFILWVICLVLGLVIRGNEREIFLQLADVESFWGNTERWLMFWLTFSILLLLLPVFFNVFQRVLWFTIPVTWKDSVQINQIQLSSLSAWSA